VRADQEAGPCFQSALGLFDREDSSGTDDRMAFKGGCEPGDLFLSMGGVHSYLDNRKSLFQ